MGWGGECRGGTVASPPPTPNPPTHQPTPLSQSFSQSYGSILPTSLTYLVPSTRGCTPWRPAAVIGTTCARATRPLDFHGPSQAGQTRPAPCSSSRPPLRQPSCFRGAAAVSKKRKLSPAPVPASPGSLRCRRPAACSGILTGFPFGGRAARFTALACSLGSTHPGPTAVRLEPCSTSVFKALS